MRKFASSRGILACVQAVDPVSWRKTHLLKSLLIMVCLTVLIMAEPTWAKLTQGEEVVTVTNALWVRVRSTPEIVPGTVLTRVRGGTQLKYLGKQDDWFKVGFSNGSEGWLHSEFGRLDSARDSLEVTAAIARVRESRDIRSPVVARAIQGLMLEILQREENWYLVRLPLGEEGWLRSDLVTLQQVEPTDNLSGPLPNEDETTASASGPAGQEAPVLEESEGVNPLSLTPLPLAASADSTEPSVESSAPTMAGPGGSSGPSLLTVFVSVFAGLSVFAIFLVVGALVMKRRAAEEMYLSDSQIPQEPEPEKSEADPVYSDPLLGWMDESSSAAKDDAKASEEDWETSPDSSVDLPEEWKDLPLPSAADTEEVASEPVEGSSWEDLASGDSLEPEPYEQTALAKEDPENLEEVLESSSDSSIPGDHPEEWKDLPLPAAEEQPKEEAASEPVESTSWEDLASGDSFEPEPGEKPEPWATTEPDFSTEAITSFEWREGSPDLEPTSEPEIEDPSEEPEEIEFETSTSWASEEPEEPLYEPEPSATEEIPLEPEPELSPPEPEAAPPETKEAAPEPEKTPDSGVVAPVKAQSGSKSSSSRSRKKGRRRSSRRRGRRSGSKKSR